MTKRRISTRRFDTLTRDLFEGRSHPTLEQPTSSPAPPATSAAITMRQQKQRLQLTPNELNQLIRDTLTYEPDTGLIRYRVNYKTHQAGDIAGNLTGHSIKKGKGYLQVQIAPGTFRYNARIAWLLQTGDWPPPGAQIDHINHITTDNRWSNLQIVTPLLNAANSRRTRRHIHNRDEQLQLLADYLAQIAQHKTER